MTAVRVTCFYRTMTLTHLISFRISKICRYRCTIIRAAMYYISLIGDVYVTGAGKVRQLLCYVLLIGDMYVTEAISR